MARQVRTVRAGERHLEVPVSSGASVSNIPNYGVSELPSTAAGNYVLDAPVEGVRKTLYSVTTTSAAQTVRASTGTTVTIDNQAATQIVFNATVDMIVDLLGVSSTRWVVTSVSPETAAVNSTGVSIGTT